MNPEVYSEQKEYEILAFAAELGGSSPEIDLHGMHAHEAGIETDTWLHRQFAAGEKAVRILHGRGDGSLRCAVHELLENHLLVAFFKDADDPKFVAGLTVVVFHQKNSST